MIEPTPRTRSRDDAVLRRSLRAAILVGTSLGLLAGQSAWIPARAQGPDGPRLLHLPLRWCVLEGTLAARSGADAAVLERLRRGSSVLAPRAGITLRSAINRSLAVGQGFPVIRDPRPGLGRPGDVRVPTESASEYRLVVAECHRAWQDLQRSAGPVSPLRGVAHGPIAVIIRDFVNAAGQPVGNVWGFAFSASSNPGYCVAGQAPIRHASGGSLLVVDSSDGSPSALLDRRLVAHEVGHVLRLGHGDGLDDPGSLPGRIDKFCDDTESVDRVPGSLMSASLRYEGVTPWQRLLARNVVSRHPGSLEERLILEPRPRPRQVSQLQRLANGGSRLVGRTILPGSAPLSPLPRLRGAGVRGDGLADTTRDLADAPGGAGSGSADLRSVDLSVDEVSGDVRVGHTPRGAPGTLGSTEHATAIDADGDPATGGDAADIEGGPMPGTQGLEGLEVVTSVLIEGGSIVGRGWRWESTERVWRELHPPPLAELAEAAGEEDDVATPAAVVLTLPAGTVDLGDRPRLHAHVRTTLADGLEVIDVVPGEPGAGEEAARELASLDLATPEYPVCRVDRDAAVPGRVAPGDVGTIEAFGFGRDGPVSVWLGDASEPLARGYYEEVPDASWPWVSEITIPAATEEALHIVQVALEGTGLTAECPILVGAAALPAFD